MPSHDGLGLNEDQRRPPAAPSPSQQHPEHPVTSAEVSALDRPLQGSQLVPQGKILENDFLMPAAGQGDRAQEQQNQFEHRLIVSWVAAEINASAGRTGLCRTTPSGCREPMRYWHGLSRLVHDRLATADHARNAIDAGALRVSESGPLGELY
jgi:hypothetical protein